jgi:hypothetical protein
MSNDQCQQKSLNASRLQAAVYLLPQVVNFFQLPWSLLRAMPLNSFLLPSRQTGHSVSCLSDLNKAGSKICQPLLLTMKCKGKGKVVPVLN